MERDRLQSVVCCFSVKLFLEVFPVQVKPVEEEKKCLERESAVGLPLFQEWHLGKERDTNERKRERREDPEEVSNFTREYAGRRQNIQRERLNWMQDKKKDKTRETDRERETAKQGCGKWKDIQCLSFVYHCRWSRGYTWKRQAEKERGCWCWWWGRITQQDKDRDDDHHHHHDDEDGVRAKIENSYMQMKCRREYERRRGSIFRSKEYEDEQKETRSMKMMMVMIMREKEQ